MPSTNSGRIIKSRKGKTGTPHQKNHRWESFTTKISKLHSLDPLRKVRRHDLDAEDLHATTSYFRNGLEKWADLDISKGFTAFKREVMPLCESLPQILHFENKIMELLEKYISRQEKESLESLLDLLTAFAHDLGTRFEKHYPSALAMITQIASKHQDAAVIEWTFASLAFLFKYLSRLLVADIRPTYDVLAPLLGKARNPPYIARFAAEAMSFLVKKAAAPSYRENSLPSIIEHARVDLESIRDDRQYGLYYHGIMTMFAEAIKGQGQGVHTTGPAVLKALIASVPTDQCYSRDPQTWADAVCGVLVSIVHHTTADTFEPIIQSIYEARMAAVSSDSHVLQNILFIRLLGIIAGVRKGTRVTNWPGLLDCQRESLKLLCKNQSTLGELDSSMIWDHILVNLAIIWKQAPMDSVIPHIVEFMETLTREPLMSWFIPFCAHFSELDAPKFRSLFLKYFQKFIMAHWSEGSNEDMLCVVLPRMVRSRALPSTRDTETFSLPQSWQDQIVTKFERLEISPFPEEGASTAYDKDPKTWRDRCLPKYAALLGILECTSVRPSTNGPIADILLRKLKLALRPSESLATDEARFIVSQGFSSYLRMSKAAGQLDTSLGPLLRAAAPRYCRLVGFLEAMLVYEEHCAILASPESQKDGSASPEKEEDPLLRSLISNLSSQSSELRLCSLRLLEKLDSAPDQLDILATMLQTEVTSLDLQNVRAIAVHLRKLGASYSQLDENSWLRQAVPAFLFGMLTVRLMPVWESAVDALKQIGASRSGEGNVCDRAFDWLQTPSIRWDGVGRQPMAPTTHGYTDFECSNLTQLLEKASNSRQVVEDVADIMLQEFEEKQQLIPEKPGNARSQALKVLTATPGLVEKRSRKFVPMFLSWAAESEDHGEALDEEDLDGESGSWSLADRKGMLGVFAQFANPKVLFQNEQVYEALLRMLGNGDIDIQKAALKAILAWKQEGVRPYQENLEFLLDEARFKNELTVLFQGDNQIQPKHHSEAMPVLLRLLYGRTISKKGTASGRGGLQATRLAVIRSLSVEDMGGFLEIALGDLRGVEIIDENSHLRDDVINRDMLTVRKQVGFLNMISSMINELGASVSTYATTITNAVLYCLISACRKLGQLKESEEQAEGNTSLLRNVRSMGLKCVISLLRNAPSFNWALYSDVIVTEVVSPRLDNLPTESTEGVSGTLQLLFTFSAFPKTALFLGIDNRVLGKLTELLLVGKAKDDVKIFSLSILRNLIRLAQAPAAESEFNELIKEDLLDPSLDFILERIGKLLRNQETDEGESGKQLGKDLLSECVETVVELSPLIQASGNTTELIDISVYLLNQPPRRVHPKVKGNVLTILENFLHLNSLDSNKELRQRIYSTISGLYNFFRDRFNREALSRVLSVFGQDDPVISEVANLCAGLNSYVEGRIDQPDYGRRLAAFNSISKPRDIPFSPQQWEPLLQNMLYYIKQDEEYGVLSSNSADCIARFIDTVSSSTGNLKESFLEMLSNVVLPAVFAGARDPSETVRREVVRVLGYMVSHMPSWPSVSDLIGLDPPPDEKDTDPSFFSHILSPATSRQMRALQLLSKVNYHAELGSRNLAHFFIPLLEHFIFGREDGGDDHGVGAQASTTIAELAISLEWPQYRAILSRYIGYIKSKPDYQKHIVRLLGKLMDTLSLAGSEKYDDTMELDDGAAQSHQKKHRLSKTMPSLEKFSDDIVSNILPPLIDYIHEKDETNVSSRVPVGVIIVKVLKLLPPELLEQKLPGILTDICHILRSKAWESREMARDTLAKMTLLLGPSCFGFVLDELRGALTKGYQLHVLSYTMHTILIAMIPQIQPGDLDYCLDKIMAIIMDDIFGATGQEKDAEEYISKMKEVKSSKSQDSMELIAKTASITHLVALVKPLQSLLMEKLDLRTVRKIDELLGRIANGLFGNAAAESQETLIFCYEIIQKVYAGEKPEAEKRLDPKLRRYLVQKGAKKSGDDRGNMNKYTYKLVRFAFDILRSVLKKHDSLRKPSNISGFIPIFGDAVVGGEEEVKIAVFKLLTVLVKVPFKTDDWEKLYKVAAKDAIKSISISSSTSSDLAQTALKLVSVILRDRPDTPVKDTAVDMLLGKLKDDLTEPLYRHVTFNFLRTVLDRKVETADVYDTLDYVGTIMITNDDKDTRDLARGAFFQFLRNYPQKKNRWQKQLTFIVANLKYDREGGRLSVMEVIHLLLMKSAEDFVQEIATTCFIPLFFVLANDDSEKCRLAAGELIKEIFRRADKERTAKFLTLMRNWLDQNENQHVLRLSIQTFRFYFDAKEPTTKEQKDVGLVVDKILQIFGDYTSYADDWELINTIVQTLPVLIEKYEALILANEDLWHAIAKPLASSNPTVKLSSIKLLNRYLADFYEHSKATGETESLTGSHGLRLDSDAVEALVILAVNILNPEIVARWQKRVAKKSTSEITGSNSVSLSVDTEEELAGEVVRTLARLAQFLDAKPTSEDEDSDDGAENSKDVEAEDEEEWSGLDGDESASPATSRVTRHTLFTLLSDILVTETAARSSALVPKMASMQLLSHYITTYPAPSLVPSLNILLTPLHHLTDPYISVPMSTEETFKVRYEDLKNKAQELLDVLQTKVGTEAYTRELLAVRESVRRRREGRARKRKIEAVAQPEKYGKWKRGKLDKKIKRRKEKAGEQRQRRHGALY